jgi:hypothetical protein
MDINPTDDKKDLFLITNVITEELMTRLSKEVLEDIPFTKQEWQENWKRRKLVVSPGSVFEQIQQQINSQKELISVASDRSISNITTVFWLDLPGFEVRSHFDHSSVDVVMQLYLKDCEGMGTVFYNPHDDDIEFRDEDGQRVHYIGEDGSYLENAIRHTFECKKNTGYFMINNDGQLHGVPNILPENELRLSAYCYLEFDTIDE